MHGLGAVMSSLQEWSKKKFGNILKELNKARKNLEVLCLNKADQCVIRQATDHMNEFLYKEEMLWMQRSRIN
jgi:ribosomal protein L30/L7E